MTKEVTMTYKELAGRLGIKVGEFLEDVNRSDLLAVHRQLGSAIARLDRDTIKRLVIDVASRCRDIRRLGNHKVPRPIAIRRA
ncbi:hypothetical protein [Rhizobium sp. BK176]|uniref:hypothetical protein n=1 Tax=Rhizobium sp. BK176 TaxID=2587071 RepID=UPI002167EA25|nr:hypothetical protein [Rhizobium sp. BK176]MCS4088937.1 hypothetical protein [Rhizobium sp. BK176]